MALNLIEVFDFLFLPSHQNLAQISFIAKPDTSKTSINQQQRKRTEEKLLSPYFLDKETVCFQIYLHVIQLAVHRRCQGFKWHPSLQKIYVNISHPGASQMCYISQCSQSNIVANDLDCGNMVITRLQKANLCYIIELKTLPFNLIYSLSAQGTED